MGLDQYAIKFKSTQKKTTNIVLGSCKQEDLFYWRKHPNLHGWMTDLYLAKAGDDSGMQWGTLGSGNVELDRDDLDSLEDATHGNGLPVTEGFFFGKSSPEDDKDTLKFIALAREAISKGYRILYLASW